MSRLREFLHAARHDGWRNAWCRWCWLRPAAADDIGFWFISPHGEDQRPACQRCLHGTRGDLHRARWGVGER